MSNYLFEHRQPRKKYLPMVFHADYKWMYGIPLSFATLVNRSFKLPYDNIIDIYYIMGKEIRQNFEVVDKMPFFFISMMVEKFQKEVEEKNKRQEAENKKYEKDMKDSQKGFNTDSFMNGNQIKMPSMSDVKMPDMGSFKL